ncbi:hypothetical protein QFC21_002159 [Naganishia friedmannii]|uniref:Uncharacterized protein n=1 Tax=Naganishia friedmannii TaxID=89922 RepID=A0ACC2VZY2_9TREE|nr:hypothetical protein QFC21_002159 [Naganishia friedmannii]
MILNKKLTGSSMPIWSLLFLISHLLSPVAAALFRWPTGGRLVLEFYYDNNTAPTSIATPTEPVTTFIPPAPIVIRTSTSVALPTPAASVIAWLPTATMLPLGATAVSHQAPLPSASIAPSLDGEVSGPSDCASRLAEATNDTPDSSVNQQQDFLNSFETFIGAHRMKDPIHFAFPNTSAYNSFDELFRVDQARTGSKRWTDREPSADDDHKPSVANLTDVEQKRLHLIMSSRAHHFGSFVISPFGGYTIDCGLTRLPKYWSPDLDPPLINDLGNEWQAAIASKHRKAAKFEAAYQESKANQLAHESETATLKRRNTELSDLIAEGVRKIEQLDRTLKDADNKNSLADLKLNYANKKYLRATMYEFKTRHSRSTTDPGSTAVTLFIPPLYPPLPPTPFAFLAPRTWRPKVAWKIAQDKAWPLYRAFCLATALFVLFCILYVCEPEDELPPAPTAATPPPPPPPPQDENIYPGSIVSSSIETRGSDNHPDGPGLSASYIQPRQVQTQDRGTQTDLTDSGRTVTQAVPEVQLSGLPVPTQSGPASSTERSLSPHVEAVASEEVNEARSPFPTCDFNFTPPKPEPTTRRSNTSSPSTNRVPSTVSGPARNIIDEKVSDVSQQAREHLVSSSAAGPSSASKGKGKQVVSDLPVLTTAPATVYPAPTTVQSTTSSNNEVSAPAPKPLVETTVEPVINDTSVFMNKHVVTSPAPNTWVETEINSINLNATPLYSIAALNDTVMMPVHEEQAPTLPVRPAASSYTFFTQPVPHHQAPSNIPVECISYLSLVPTVYENTAPAARSNMAEFPFQGDYPPWTAPVQPAVDMDVDTLPTPTPQASIDPVWEEPVIQTSVSVFELIAAREETHVAPAVQQEHTALIGPAAVTVDIQPDAQPHAPSNNQEETPSQQEPVEEATLPAPTAPLPPSPEALADVIAATVPTPTSEIMAAPLDPTLTQEETKDTVDSPVKTPPSETAIQSQSSKPKAAVQAARNLKNKKAKAVAKESTSKPKGKGVKGKKMKSNKKKAVLGGVADGAVRVAAGGNEDSGDEEEEVDDLI